MLNLPLTHTPVIFDIDATRFVLEYEFPLSLLVHNQPSGDPTPSQADIAMTKAIVDIATSLGISVHDHIIVGKDGHASL